MSLKTPLEVREEQREDKRIAIYTLGCTGLVETDFAAYVEQWLMNAPRLSIALPLSLRLMPNSGYSMLVSNFAHILKDLKKRNYKVTAEAIPDFERARLSILRHLSLLRLNKR